MSETKGVGGSKGPDRNDQDKDLWNVGKIPAHKVTNQTGIEKSYHSKVPEQNYYQGGDIKQTFSRAWDSAWEMGEIGYVIQLIFAYVWPWGDVPKLAAELNQKRDQNNTKLIRNIDQEWLANFNKIENYVATGDYQALVNFSAQLSQAIVKLKGFETHNLPESERLKQSKLTTLESLLKKPKTLLYNYLEQANLNIERQLPYETLNNLADMAGIKLPPNKSFGERALLFATELNKLIETEKKQLEIDSKSAMHLVNEDEINQALKKVEDNLIQELTQTIEQINKKVAALESEIINNQELTRLTKNKSKIDLLNEDIKEKRSEIDRLNMSLGDISRATQTRIEEEKNRIKTQFLNENTAAQKASEKISASEMKIKRMTDWMLSLKGEIEKASLAVNTDVQNYIRISFYLEAFRLQDEVETLPQRLSETFTKKFGFLPESIKKEIERPSSVWAIRDINEDLAARLGVSQFL